MRSGGFVCFQFDGVPVNLVGALSQRSMGNEAAVADEDDAGDGASLNLLVAARIDASRLVVNPLETVALVGQIDCAAVARHFQSHKEYIVRCQADT